MYFRLAVLITLICLAFGDVIQKSDEGDVNVSQSVSAQDKEGCGSPTMPCKTLPYASRQCQTQYCSFVIDGGAKKGSYAYILNGNDTFSVASMGIRVQAKAGGSTPVIVCNQTGRYDSCFNVNGRGISVDGFEFVSTSADGQLREETSSPSKDFVSSDAKPMLVFSSGQTGSSITNCQFHDVTINIETVTIISNWFMTGSQVKWQQYAPTTLQGCDFRGCNFQIEGGPPLNMNGTMMIQTTFDVTGE